jgi:hypothetical protein
MQSPRKQGYRQVFVLDYFRNAKRTPKELLVKRDMLIVGCIKSPALHVYDLNTGQSRGEIAVSGKGPGSWMTTEH